MISANPLDDFAGRMAQYIATHGAENDAIYIRVRAGKSATRNSLIGGQIWIASDDAGLEDAMSTVEEVIDSNIESGPVFIVRALHKGTSKVIDSCTIRKSNHLPATEVSNQTEATTALGQLAAVNCRMAENADRRAGISLNAMLEITDLYSQARQEIVRLQAQVENMQRFHQASETMQQYGLAGQLLDSIAPAVVGEMIMMNRERRRDKRNKQRAAEGLPPLPEEGQEPEDGASPVEKGVTWLENLTVLVGQHPNLVHDNNMKMAAMQLQLTFEQAKAATAKESEE
jgi:hypothetical protein